VTIPFEEIKARLLADPEVQREYDALAPEFEALAESIKAKKAQRTKSPSSSRVLKRDPDLIAECRCDIDKRIDGKPRDPPAQQIIQSRLRHSAPLRGFGLRPPVHLHNS
jgi:hypothetical protein